MPNIDPIYAVLTVMAALYAVRVGFFVIGFGRERNRWRQPGPTPRVTIVVPARNEAANLERCVESLARMEYPEDALQIIVVDDRSEDATPAILDALAERYPTLVPLHRTSLQVDPNLRGKPGALQFGIDHADGELILMTDADCVVAPTWVRGMVAQFGDPQVGLVAGLTSIESDGFLDRVQDVEWTYTQAMAAGGVGNGVPLGCFGNNVAVRRSAFEGVGGYRSIRFSVTEDLALQDTLHRAGWRVRHAVHRDTSVVTLPAVGLGEYLKQRHRWVRGGTALGMRATVFVLSSIALWLGMAISVATGDVAWLVGFVLLRVAGDGTLITMAARAVGRGRLVATIPPAILLLMSTELFLPILAMKRTVVWKNQVFRP